MMRSPFPYTLIVLGIAVGLLLTAQWKTPPQRIVNPVAPYFALNGTRLDLVKEQTTLKQEITRLQLLIDSQTRTARQDQGSKSLAEQAENLKKKVGMIEVKGGGVQIVLDDAASGEGTNNNIAHAADLRDMVNVLWKNGASAISINGERVVASTSIDCIVNTILINDTRKVPPFEILAIGDSTYLKESLDSAAELDDLRKRVAEQGVVLKIKTSWRLTIPAFNGSIPIQFAKIED